MKKCLAASAVAVAMALLAVVAGASPASAAGPTGYGDHVSGHARAHGFSGDRNPGDHRGFAGYDEDHQHSM